MDDVNTYHYCEENSALLQRFLDEVASHPQPANKWTELFKPEQPLSGPVTVTSTTTNVTIDLLSPSSDVIAQPEISESKVESNNILCQLFEGNSDYLIYGEISTMHESAFEHTAKNLSEQSIVRFFRIIEQHKPPSKLLNSIFNNFLLKLVIIKPHTRFLENIVLGCYKRYPDSFLNASFLIKFLKQQTSYSIFDNLVKSVGDEDRKLFLNTITGLMLDSETFFGHIPAFITLCKSTKDAYLNNVFIELLYSHKERGSVDKNYGKLLLAVIQNASSSNFDALEDLCGMHQTVFKMVCLNALNKMKM